jgi:hypothetical protein
VIWPIESGFPRGGLALLRVDGGDLSISSGLVRCRIARNRLGLVRAGDGTIVVTDGGSWVVRLLPFDGQDIGETFAALNLVRG